jgi:hypothetical protein
MCCIYVTRLCVCVCVCVAWVLGLWLTKGDADCAAVKFGADKDHSIMQRLQSWSTSMTGLPIGCGIVEADTTGNPIRLGLAFERLLDSYGLFKGKHFPPQVLQESPAVRRHLLAGVIDGDGECHKHGYEVGGQDRHFIDGLVHLARGLGFTTGKVDQMVSAAENHTWRVDIGGNDLATLPIALQSKKAQTPLVKHKRCHGFTIKKRPAGDWHGFTVSQPGGAPSNGRLLMSDFVVSHNTFTMEGIRSDPILRGIIPRTFDQIFDFINTTDNSGDKKFLVAISYVEIYSR